MDDESIFWRDLSNPPLKLVRGKGVYLFDEAGNKYLDAASGAAVCSLGSGNSEIAQTLKEQAKELSYAHMSKFYSQALADWTDQLISVSPDNLTKVHPVSGGSEANETAIKLARKYHLERGNSKKYKIISRATSYHGATLTALSLSGKTSRQEEYAPMMSPNPKISPAYCYRCPYNRDPDKCSLECASDLERAIVQEGESTIAGFIAEPVSGSSAPGVHPPDRYWGKIREICDEYGVLLIVDEVMSGMGRTGKWWAIEHSNVEPDIISTSKGLGGGYVPLGAIIVHDNIHKAVKDGEGSMHHGFTYGGNPVCAAVGSKIIQIMEREGLVGRAASMGERLLQSLRDSLGDHPYVGEIRGRGLLIGLEFVKDRTTKEPFEKSLNLPRRLRQSCLNHGLYVYPGGSPVNGQKTTQTMIAPPFIIEEGHIEEIVNSLLKSIGEVFD
ncbi:aspartate aminotransferase family protein [Candidatus Bipolaricaulota bacterium]|nr:aspartate aminotransferase family protein [Candidatus Bipolaricaulota bacterium]